MARRNPKQKFDINRGRHRKHASDEVRAWDDRCREPKTPSWMDEETAEKLRKLRREVDPLR